MKLLTSIIIALAIVTPSLDAKPKKKRAAIVPSFVITDHDWVYEKGPYTAFWTEEDPNIPVVIFGPGIETGIRIVSENDNLFKTRVVFLVNALASLTE